MAKTPRVRTTLRSAVVDDAPEIARLSAELGYPVHADEMELRLARLLGGSSHYVAVAAGGNGNLLGWVHAEHRFSLEGGASAELMGLVVDALARRTGIGTKLLELAESWASQRGLATVTVRSNVVRAQSHPFYEARGYAREKTQNVYRKGLAV